MKRQQTQYKLTHAEFKRKFLPLQRALFREAFRLLCDRFDAEDAVQNLYLRLWERRGELVRIVSPENYCYTLLRNICIDRIRQLKVRDEEHVPIDEIPDTAPPDVEVSETRQCIEQFLGSVPELQRKIVQMRINGCSYEEIEEITGLSAVNVRVIVSRIRKQFRDYYNNVL